MLAVVGGSLGVETCFIPRLENSIAFLKIFSVVGHKDIAAVMDVGVRRNYITPYISPL